MTKFLTYILSNNSKFTQVFSSDVISFRHFKEPGHQKNGG